MTQVSQEGGSRSVFFHSKVYPSGRGLSRVASVPVPTLTALCSHYCGDVTRTRREVCPGTETRGGRQAPPPPPRPRGLHGFVHLGGSGPDTYWKLTFHCRHLCESSARVPCTDLCWCCGCICGPEECRTLQSRHRPTIAPDTATPVILNTTGLGGETRGCMWWVFNYAS